MGTLFYDPDCGFCARAAGWVRKLGARCAVVAGFPSILDAHGVDSERAQREIPFVDEAGSITWGSDAIASALATASAPARFAARLLRAPGLRRVAGVAYQFVARHRHQLPGGSAGCALPPSSG